MIQRLPFVFCLIFLLTGVFAAQRTVTNADLETYKQARLQADKDYRENYERLGLPSPEELEKRREASRAETETLYDKLRAERLEAAKLAVMQAAVDAQLASSPQFVPFAIPYSEPAYLYYSGGFYSNWRYPRHRPRPWVNQGYVGGGQYWPTGPTRVPSLVPKIWPGGRGGGGKRR